MNISISKAQLKCVGLALATVGMSTMNYIRRRAMEPMIIIGITGTIGAGKGTVVEYLQKNHRCTFYSFPNALFSFSLTSHQQQLHTLVQENFSGSSSTKRDWREIATI